MSTRAFYGIDATVRGARVSDPFTHTLPSSSLALQRDVRYECLRDMLPRLAL